MSFQHSLGLLLQCLIIPRMDLQLIPSRSQLPLRLNAWVQAVKGFLVQVGLEPQRWARAAYRDYFPDQGFHLGFSSPFCSISNT